MSNNNGKREKWIICKSKKQIPNRNYLFNTVTGESQWVLDVEDIKVEGNEDSMNPNLLQTSLEHEPSLPVVKKETSPFSSTESEGLAQSMQEENFGFDADNFFDLRQVLNWKRHLQMDMTCTSPQPTAKNIANRRMCKLREKLNLDSEVDPPKIDLNQNCNDSTKSKSPVANYSRFSDTFVNNSYPNTMLTYSNHPAHINTSNRTNFDEFANSYNLTQQSTERPLVRNIVPVANRNSSQDTYLINNSENNRKRKYEMFDDFAITDTDTKISMTSKGAEQSNNIVFNNNNSTSEFRLNTYKLPNVARNSDALKFSVNDRLNLNSNNIPEPKLIESKLPVSNEKSSDDTNYSRSGQNGQNSNVKFSVNDRLRNINNISETRPSLQKPDLPVSNRKSTDDTNNSRSSHNIQISNVKKFSVNDRLRNINNTSETRPSLQKPDLPVCNRKSTDDTNNSTSSHNVQISNVKKFSANDRLRNINNISETRPSLQKPDLSAIKRSNNHNQAENSHKTIKVSNSNFSVNDRLHKIDNGSKEKQNSFERNDDPLSVVKKNLSRGNEINNKKCEEVLSASKPPLNKYIEDARKGDVEASRSEQAEIPKISNTTVTSNNLQSQSAKSSTVSGFANSRLKSYRDSLRESNEISNEHNHMVSTPDDVVMEQDYGNNTTVVCTNNSQESMEWETITEEKILKSVNNIRKELVEATFVPEISVNSTNDIKFDDDFKPHIVIDTNIFLSHLPFVQHILLDYNFENLGHPVIIVPWTVLQELDYIKDHSNKYDSNGKLALLARKAISFLNSSFSNNSPNLYGQNAMESSRELFQIDSSDDKILNCCLQAKEKSSNVLLLSNDQNLRTKSIVNHIPAYSKDEILQTIKKLAEVKNKASHSEKYNNNAVPEITSQPFIKMAPTSQNEKDLNVRSAIAKAPNSEIIDKKASETNSTHQILDKYLKDIVAFYKQYCAKSVVVRQKINLKQEINKSEAEIVRNVPKMRSTLLKFLASIELVTVEPHYHVKLQSLEDFIQLIKSFLKEYGIDIQKIEIADMGTFCKVERVKIIAADSRLKTALKILNAFEH